MIMEPVTVRSMFRRGHPGERSVNRFQKGASKEQRDIEREEEKKRAEMIENMELQENFQASMEMQWIPSAMDEPPGSVRFEARKERFERFMQGSVNFPLLFSFCNFFILI